MNEKDVTYFVSCEVKSFVNNSIGTFANRLNNSESFSAFLHLYLIFAHVLTVRELIMSSKVRVSIEIISMVD